MVAIPTYVYLGNDAIIGGAQPDTQLPALWAFWLNNPRFARVTPCSGDGVTPPLIGSFEPYWDGSLNSGTGAFVRYHHTAGFYIGPAKGDNWFLPTGGGVTPCTLLMAALWERYPVAPGFKLLKYAKVNAGYSSWKPGGAAWTEALAEWAKAQAAVAPGDTLDVKHVILDCSTSSIVEESVETAADAQLCITGIKATFGAGVKITLVSHRADFYLPATGLAQVARRVHQGLKIANANVRIFDMSWAEFGTDGPVGSVTAGPNQITYETIDYVDAGARLGRFLYQWDTSLPLGSVGGALETHVMIGDSNFVTANMVPDLVTLGGQQSLLGPSGTERVGQYIWDAQNEEVVPYNVAGVTNSFGSIESWWGPESTLLKRAKQNAEDRPQNPDVCVWKFAAGGAQFIYVDSALPELEEQWEKFKAAVYRDTGRTIDCRSVSICIGRNDGLSEQGRALFASRYEAFVDDVRQIFTTRADGPELAVVWLQPSPHLDSGVAGGTTIGDGAALEAVRQLIAGLPEKKPRVRVLLDPAPGSTRIRYELQRADMLHYGSEATHAIGYDLADAIAELNSEDATDADQVGGEETVQLVETVVAATPAAIVAMIDQVVLSGGDVASYQTATGQTVTLRGMEQLIRAREYYASLQSRQQGIRRTRVMFT